MFNSSVSVGVVIGGAIANSLGTALNTTSEKINKLAERTKKMQILQGQVANVNKLNGRLERLNKVTMATASGAARLNQKVEETKQDMDRAAGAVKGYGIGLKNAEKFEKTLTRAMQVREKTMRSLQKTEQRKQLRGELRGQAIDMIPQVAAMGGLVRSAMKAEESKFYLSTVITDDAKGTMARSVADIEKMARSGVMSMQQGFETMYAMFSAGLSDEAARSAAEVAGKVATVTRGVPDQVGSVLAGVYNNLGNQMTGTAGEKMQQIGDLMAKVQQKFQIKDFGQLGEGFSEASSAIAGYQVNMEQAMGVIGYLNNSMVDGSKAGTAFQGMMRNLSKATAEYGVNMVRGADGQLDLMKTLGGLQGAMANMTIDERADELQRLFGDEGKKGLVPLLDGFEKLKMAQADLGNNAGLVDAQFKKFGETGVARWKSLTGSISVMATRFGNSLLPGVIATMKGFQWLGDKIVMVSEKAPWLTNSIVGLSVGFVGLRVFSLAARYGLTMVADGVGVVFRAINFFRPSVIATNWALVKQKAASIAAGTAHAWQAGKTFALAAAQKVMAASSLIMAGATKIAGFAMAGLNMAFLASPIGWIAAGIAGAAVLIWSNWEKIGPWFDKLLGWLGDAFSWAWDGIKTLFSWSPIGLLIENWSPLMGFFSGLGSWIIEPISTAFDWVMDKFGAIAEIAGKVADWLGFGGDDEDETAKTESPARKTARNFRRPVAAATGAAMAAGVAVAMVPTVPSLPPETMSPAYSASVSSARGDGQAITVNFTGDIVVNTKAGGELDTTDLRRRLKMAVRETLAEIERDDRRRSFMDNA